MEKRESKEKEQTGHYLVSSITLELFEMNAVGHPDIKVAPKRLWPLEKLTHLDRCKDDEFRTFEELETRFNKKIDLPVIPSIR